MYRIGECRAGELGGRGKERKDRYDFKQVRQEKVTTRRAIKIGGGV